MKKLILIFTIVTMFTSQSQAGLWDDLVSKVKSTVSNKGDDVSENGTKKSDDLNSPRPDTNNIGSTTHIYKLVEVITPVRANPNHKGFEEAAYDIDAILGRTKKAAPINVAEAGSGKSALIEYLQALIDAKSDVVSNLVGKDLHYLNINKLVGGTELQGSLQARFSAIIEEMSDPKNSNKILVIDELEEVLKDEKHGKLLIETLKSYMSSEMVGAKLIFNITPGPYKKLMTDPQLIRRMLPVYRKPPSDDTVRDILDVLATDAKEKTGVTITNEQLETVLKLSKMHPKLANPDVAITVLDDAINLAIKEMNSGSKTILSLESKAKSFRNKITRLQRNRENGILKFFGPFFDHRISRYTEVINRAEQTVKSYRQSQIDTKELREQLALAIDKRVSLNKEATTARKNEDFGSVDPLTLLEELDDEILVLNSKIRAQHPMFNGLEVSVENIQTSAVNNLTGVKSNRINDEIKGGVNSSKMSARAVINEPKLEKHKVILKETIKKIISRRRFKRENQTVPAFLIIDPKGTTDSNIIFDSITKEVYGQDSSYTIDGFSITDKHQLSNHVGSARGLVGHDSDVEPLFKAVEDTNGFMSLIVKDIDKGSRELSDLVSGLVSSGQMMSPQSGLVDFRSSSVFISTSQDELKLTGEALEEFNSIIDTAQRQEYLKFHVQKNYKGLNPEDALDSKFLDNVNIIYLDEVTDLSADTLIVNELKSPEFKRALNDMEFDMEFGDTAIAFLADKVRARGGEKSLNGVLDELLEDINDAFESFRIVPGDVVSLDYNGRSFTYSKLKWQNSEARAKLVKSSPHNSQSNQINESSQKSADDLLREMSELD